MVAKRCGDVRVGGDAGAWAGLSQQAGEDRGAVHGGQRHRHPRAQRRAEAGRAVGTAGDRRESSGRGRHDRRGSRGEVAGRWVHAARALRRRRRSTPRSIRASRTTRRRTSSRWRPLGGQPNVLVVAPATGYKNVADLIAAAKEDAGCVELRFRRHRQRHAHQRREVQAGRRHRRRAHSLQGHAGSADRHDDRARDLFLFADLRRRCPTCAKAS